MTESNPYPEAGFCGNYCGKCSHYPKECPGCDPNLHKCFFIRCCQKKGIEHCGLCATFPCKKLLEFVPDNRPGLAPGYHITNLRERKTAGTQAWLEIQRAKWRKKPKLRFNLPDKPGAGG
ncbi:MAG: DUF3795 domain-containing protein [candidate division WOR-3 bacterium]